MPIPERHLAFWQAYAATLPADPAPRFLEAFHFDDNEPSANALAALVLAGTKRATAALLWAYEHAGVAVPVPGQLSIVTDFAGNAVCIIETRRVDIVAFADVDAEFAATEGEGDGSLAYWRAAHEAFFGRECQRIGRSPEPRMPVVCERFEVVWRPPAPRRIALLGGESSGKTTLARALAEALGTVWVPEYGRQLWEELRETLSVEQLLHVGRTQVAWEEEHGARARGWLVCDTTPLTTLQYCLHDHGQAPAELQALARRPYDLTVLCLPDFDFVQDGCRRDDGFRSQQHAWTLARLAEAGVQPLEVRGDVAQRVAQVLDAVRAAERPLAAARGEA